MGIDSLSYYMYVDISGLDCGAPMSKLTKAVESLEPGKTLLAVTHKASMQNEIPAYCRQMGLVLLEQGEDKEQHYFLIRK